MKFNPTTEVTSATAFSSRTIASACSTTSVVRLIEAPPGICTTTNMPPWSSSGRKPVGVIFESPSTPTPATATIAIPITEIRTSRATTLP